MHLLAFDRKFLSDRIIEVLTTLSDLSIKVHTDWETFVVDCDIFYCISVTNLDKYVQAVCALNLCGVY